MASIAVVGTGRVGLSLVSGLAATGAYREIVLFGRHRTPPDHPVATAPGVRYAYGLEPLPEDARCVLLAVPDEALPEVVNALAGLGPAPTGCAAFHLSGSLGTDVLAPLHHGEYGVGSFHPLVTFSDPGRGPSRLAGSWVAVTAAPQPMRVAQEVADGLGAEVFPVPAFRRPLFHAAITMVSSVLGPVIAHSATLLQQAGVEGEDARPALVALARSVLDRIESEGHVADTSGPVAAGDAETVALHLRALDPEDARSYASFAREGIRLLESEGWGLDPAARDTIERELERHLHPETTEVGAGH